MEEALLSAAGPVVETDVFFEADDGLVFVVSFEGKKKWSRHLPDRAQNR